MLGLSSKASLFVFFGLEVIAVGVGAALTPTWGILIACLGLLFFIPAIKELWERRTKTDGHMSLYKAALMFHEASEAGKLPKIPPGAAERLSGLEGYTIKPGTPDEVLDWWAGHIAKDVTLYGVKPPSAQRRRIRERDVKNFIFSEGATKLKDVSNDKVFYTDLTVKTKELQTQYAYENGFHEVRSS